VILEDMTTMKSHLRIASVLLLAASLAGCQGPCQKLAGIPGVAGPALTSGTADFTRYVAVGTNLSAGYQSAGLVNRHQLHAFPAYFAQQLGKTVLSSGAGDFSFPAVDGFGIAPLLQLRSISPLVISNSGLAPGSAINIAQAADYQNLAVPGALAWDFADTTSYYTNNAPIFRSNPTMFGVVARHRGALAQQVLRQAPTFISFEYGVNEVLGSTSAGTASLVFPSAGYAAILTGAMNAIHTLAPTAKLALLNVPNVMAIPFCTTFRPYTATPGTSTLVPLLGPGGVALDPARDLVLLTAKDSLAIGTGFPTGAYNYLNPAAPGNGRPLRDSQVLSGSEQTTINAAISDMNAAVDSVALRPWIVKVDLNGLLNGIATSGYEVGTTHYSSAFVSGGLFSLDGVHPNDLCHAIIANTMIDAVNARFGATVPRVDLSTAGTLTAWSARPAGTDGAVIDGMQLEGLEQGFKLLFQNHP
jgi:hypothetical protein